MTAATMAGVTITIRRDSVGWRVRIEAPGAAWASVVREFADFCPVAYLRRRRRDSGGVWLVGQVEAHGLGRFLEAVRACGASIVEEE